MQDRSRKRQRSQPHTFEEQLANEAHRVRSKADLLPPGSERNALLAKLEQIDAASKMNAWLTSPGLRSPT